MKLLARQVLVSTLALGLILPATVFATNGMFMIGYGSKSRGMGGVGVAYPQDGMAAAFNPASMIEVGEVRFDASLDFFRPPRAVKHESALLPADEKSKGNLFPLPGLGAVMSNPSTPIALGFAMIGAGLGTNYQQGTGNFFDPNLTNAAYKRVGVNLIQMQMLPSIAYRLNETHTVGASFVIAMQTFRAFGLEAFQDLGFTNTQGGLTGNGDDWSFGGGIRLGWLGTFFDKRLMLGVNYSPVVQMQKFNRYRGLFAQRGEFNIPENYAIGMSYKVDPKLTVAFDVQRILWSEIPSIGNPGPDASDPNQFFSECETGNTDPCLLGGVNGLGFGWKNQIVYKLGVDYKYRKNLVVRAGYNYGKSPITEGQVLFNMLAPATVEDHLTLGATYTTKNDSEISVHFMHAFENTIKGPTAFPPSGITRVVGSNASIAMSQTAIGIGYGSKF